MIHLEVDPHELARHTPFQIDVFHGRAFVSLVAFFMRRFRLRGTGCVGSWAFSPTTHHSLFNVRTYVRHHGEPGICFLTEWVPNPVSTFLGPRFFGLPYRLGRLHYSHEGQDEWHGCVRSAFGSSRLDYRSHFKSPKASAVAEPGSLAEFLVERYTAFTLCCGRRRFFRIWHEPWRICNADVELTTRSLLSETGIWLRSAEAVGGHCSEGVRDVWIGRPRALQGADDICNSALAT
jgi:uncharacterized protein YqjF (DUF2071 family)